VFVTWRLGDSLPKAKLDQWKAERDAWMKHHPEPWEEETEAEYHDRFSRQIDEWLRKTESTKAPGDLEMGLPDEQLPLEAPLPTPPAEEPVPPADESAVPTPVAESPAPSTPPSA
jgi:hypothetical protein